MTVLDPFYAELGELAAQARGGLPCEESRLGQDVATKADNALQVRWVRDALANPPPEPPVLIEGMLRAGELCVIGAARGIGKSWLVGNMATLLDRGEGYLFGQLRIMKPCKVLIVQGEIDEWESWRRWCVLTNSDGAPLGVAETFDRVRVRTTRHRSTSSASIEGTYSSASDEWTDALLDPRLEAAIGEHGFEVLLIDPWAVFYSGAENSNDEVEAALDKLRDLAMRYRVAVVIMHHVGKGVDVREPEDLWRGASRLADWASTRITLMPHFTAKQAKGQGMTRQQARRYVDVLFLRRSTPTPDFSMVLDPETCWWSRWAAPSEVAAGRRIQLSVDDVVEACRKDGGSWPSARAAAESLGISPTTAAPHLAAAVQAGALKTAKGAHNATIYRLPSGLSLVEGGAA